MLKRAEKIKFINKNSESAKKAINFVEILKYLQSDWKKKFKIGN